MKICGLIRFLAFDKLHKMFTVTTQVSDTDRRFLKIRSFLSPCRKLTGAYQVKLKFSVTFDFFLNFHDL